MAAGRSSFASRIESAWTRRGAGALLLSPLAVAFGALVALRRWLYRIGVLRARRLPVPVVVIGNIRTGGTGKTPVVLWLAQRLAERGRAPGIVSRGYGGATRAPRPVTPADEARVVGDEPLLLARRARCPVWIGRDRVAAGQALLAANPGCDLILADDGLQHYRLARDVEIVVLDERGAGNGWLLPAGPLREPACRLREVDAVVANGGPADGAARPIRFAMRLSGRVFRRVAAPDETCPPQALAGARLHAIAGIGHPQRFFAHLRSLGLEFVAHSFPDHHPFAASDLAFEPGSVVLMTEKDAVKCSAFAPHAAWFLPVEAVLEPDLAEFIVEKLNGCAAA